MANRPKKHLSRLLLRSAALGFGAAGLVAVLLSTTVWQPGEGIAPSQADIVDLLTLSDKPNVGFERALKSLGHEPPRAFDINGNTVYFSVNYVDKPLDEVLRRYQDEFVYQQLNQRTYLSLEDAHSQQAYKDMLTGGIVPAQIGPGYVAMGGGIPQNRAASDRELLELGGQVARGELDNQFVGYRHIEAFKENDGRYTTVVASWSDDKFDYQKMLAGSEAAEQEASRHSDPRVPSCPGCTRVHRFDDLDPDADYTEHIFLSREEPSRLQAFYDKELRAHGWQPSPASATLAFARDFNLDIPAGHSMQYRRGQENMNLLIYLRQDGDGQDNDNNAEQTVAHLTLFDN